jgi:hypothetical protein
VMSLSPAKNSLVLCACLRLWKAFGMCINQRLPLSSPLSSQTTRKTRLCRKYISIRIHVCGFASSQKRGPIQGMRSGARNNAIYKCTKPWLKPKGMLSMWNQTCVGRRWETEHSHWNGLEKDCAGPKIR